MKKFFKELYVRVSMESPDAFKKLRKLFTIVLGICLALIKAGINFEVCGYDLPKIMVLLTTGATVMSYLGVKDTEALSQTLEKK